MTNLITNLTLKPLSETRWESRIEALKSLTYQIGEIYDAFFEIQNDSKFDNETRHQARNLAIKIKNFHFLCSLILWSDILHRINVVSKMLQNIKTDIGTTLIAIKNIIEYIGNYRSDDGLEKLLQDAIKLASTLEISGKFEPIQEL